VQKIKPTGLKLRCNLAKVLPIVDLTHKNQYAIAQHPRLSPVAVVLVRSTHPRLTTLVFEFYDFPRIATPATGG
jgi:hypothetical protein